MRVWKKLHAVGFLLPLFFSASAAHAQKPSIATRPFSVPHTGVPAPLGTRVPVIFGHGRGWHWEDGSYADIGIGVGIGGSFSDGFGPAYGVGFGAYGYGYNGFYLNGFSEYGPPVPTYNPVPGVFGGADYRFYGTNFYGPNVGPIFSTQPFPASTARPVLPDANPSSNSLLPNVPLSQIPPTPLNEMPEITPPSSAPLTMIFLVPEGATVYFDNNPTKQTGKVRTFASPERKYGESMQYQIRVDWIENGVPKSRNRTVAGKAGEKISVDFTKD